MAAMLVAGIVLVSIHHVDIVRRTENCACGLAPHYAPVTTVRCLGPIRKAVRRLKSRGSACSNSIWPLANCGGMREAAPAGATVCGRRGAALCAVFRTNPIRMAYQKMEPNSRIARNHV
jgi:hypothetical protein